MSELKHGFAIIFISLGTFLIQSAARRNVVVDFEIPTFEWLNRVRE